ncbi:hypothetical protein RJ640_012950 [Escallonia rubra]|uniref:Myb-like domain-containing protein n=1 Tax=Escallonia rubra TaxID=112253 RepID=A0AA88QW07_9ASTE|nr:hypothetical protein RJ640_012950 [Escallonia rubra]
MAATPDKPPRKFPPPCWTQEEALSLIEAYRERWYELRRGYLRTADWDAVAAAVGVRCPGASPAKTSAQCRHKMEKLRQRYRAEKQRALSYPGRFFSSWFFFESMDAMENGSSAGGPNQEPGDQPDSGNPPRIKAVTGQSMILSSKNSKKADGSNQNLDFEDEGMDPEGGFRPKSVGERNSLPFGIRVKRSSRTDVKPSPNYAYRVPNGYSSYLDYGSDEDADDAMDYGGGFRLKTPLDGNSAPPAFRAQKVGKNVKNLAPNFNSDHVGGGGFRGKIPVDQDLGFRPKKFNKIGSRVNADLDWEEGAYDGIDANGEFWVKMPSERNSVPPGFRAKYGGKTERNSNPNLDSRGMNGFSSKNGGEGVKRGRGSIAEMVSSIKLLGEGFVKMEKMKMEMAMEIEKMRAEMEMKRNQLLLESQQQIVDAFVKGLVESKKVKPTVPAEADTTKSPACTSGGNIEPGLPSLLPHSLVGLFYSIDI